MGNSEEPPALNWMRVTENTPSTGVSRLLARPGRRLEIVTALRCRPSGGPGLGGMNIHLGGSENDLSTFEGKLSKNCVERVEGEDVVLPYSGGPVKENRGILVWRVAHRRGYHEVLSQ